MSNHSARMIFRSLLGFFLFAALGAAGTGQVTQLPNQASITAGHIGSLQAVYIAGFATDGDGGGGYFSKITSFNGTPCASLTADGGILLKDLDGVCWLGQIEGAVDLRRYGIPDATTSACLLSRASCDGTTAFNRAVKAANTYGNGRVTTGGRSIVIAYAADVTVTGLSQFTSPANFLGTSIDCEAPATGQSRQSGSGGTAIPYYQQRGALIINPAHRLIFRQSTTFQNCRVFPTWYTSEPTSIRDVINDKHLFTGSPLLFGGGNGAAEGITVKNIFIMGFDVCFDINATPRSSFSDIVPWCNVQAYVHNQRSHFRLDNWNSKNIFSFGATSSSGRIDFIHYPVTAMGNAGGEVQLTLDNSVRANELADGDPILVDNIGGTSNTNTTGDLNGTVTISNIPPEGASTIRQNSTITDLGGSGCIAANSTVVDIMIDGDGIGTVTMNHAATCTATARSLRFTGTGFGPASANGLHTLKDVTPGSPDATHTQVTLAHSVWTGVTSTHTVAGTGANWRISTNVVTVQDVTNMKAGMYLCASGTAPLCTPPTGFTFATTTLGTTLDSSSTYTSVIVSSTLNWPCYNTPPNSSCSSVIQIGTELMAVMWIDLTHVAITQRGWDGTTAAAHAISDTVTSAAPVIAAVIPSANALRLNATAQSTQTNQTVSVLNDLAVSGRVAELTLNTGYMINTALVAAGPAINGTVSTTGNGTVGTNTLTIDTNYWKVMQGMTVTDVTNPNKIPSGTTVTNDPTSGALTLSANIAGSDIVGDVILITGCGYPTASWWTGNCVSTSHLYGGNTGTLDAQGINATNIHTFGNRVAIHVFNTSGTEFSQIGLANGGATGAQLDGGSASFWADGESDTCRISNIYLVAQNGIVNTPASGSSRGCVFANMTFGASHGVLVTNVGATANITLTNPVFNLVGDIYEDSAAANLIIVGANMPRVGLYYNNVLALGDIYCTASKLDTNVCTDSSADHGNKPVGVNSMSDFTSGSFTSVQYVNLAGYYGIGTGGGGLFESVVAGSATPDSAIYVVDSSGNLFKRSNDNGDVREFGAYCDIQEFYNTGTTTAGNATITTGTYQAPQSAVGLPIILPTSGAAPFYPNNTFTITAPGTGYAVGDVLTVVGGTGTAARLTVFTVDGSGGVTSAIWNVFTDYGSYTVIPANPVAVTGGGGSGATFTLRWTGATFITTIASVGINTINLTVAPSVTQNTIPVWYFGHDDYAAIAADMLYQTTHQGNEIQIPGACGTGTRITMPANAGSVSTAAQRPIAPLIIGSGMSGSLIVPTAAMTNLMWRTTPFSVGGGLHSLTLNGMGLTTGPVLSIENGVDMDFMDLEVLNATGAGNAEISEISDNGARWRSIRVRTESSFSGAVFPDYNFKMGSEAGHYAQIDAVNAKLAGIWVNGGGGKIFGVHTFGSGGASRSTYGLYITNDTLLYGADIDGAATANIFVSANGVILNGGNMNCGNNSAVRATNAVELATAIQYSEISGITFDSSCAWPAANKIVQDGTANATTEVFGNAGASYVRLRARLQLPQGRLSLSSTLPVMAADQMNTSTVYYLPYISTLTPVFNGLSAAGSNTFASYQDVGAGLTFTLDTNAGHTNFQASGNVYDIFIIQDNSAVVELCTGPAWSSTTSRGTGAGTSELAREANSGIWVNANELTACRYGTASNNTKDVQANQAIYLGSMYATANGKTAMVFQPAAASGGGSPVLGLYNAYNKVPFLAQSLDTAAQYTYGTATWRSANNSTSNSVRWLDGLADVFAHGLVRDYIANDTACLIGVDLDSTSATPAAIGRFDTVAASALGSNVTAAINTTPTLGLHTHQAMEYGTNAACKFGNGSGYQQLEWQGNY